MFKIVTKNEELKEKLKKYSEIISDKDYMYIITDDKSIIEDDKINIYVPKEMSDDVELIINATFSVTDIILNVKKNGEVFKLTTEEIDYFESIDNVVYAKSNKELYSCSDKLYSLEEMLIKKNFVRTSKYCLVNIHKIRSIIPLLNSKLLLILKTGDRIEVNRTYVKDFKNRIKLK